MRMFCLPALHARVFAAFVHCAGNSLHPDVECSQLVFVFEGDGGCAGSDCEWHVWGISSGVYCELSAEPEGVDGQGYGEGAVIYRRDAEAQRKDILRNFLQGVVGLLRENENP